MASESAGQGELRKAVELRRAAAESAAGFGEKEMPDDLGQPVAWKPDCRGLRNE